MEMGRATAMMKKELDKLCWKCGSSLGHDCGEAEPDYNQQFCSAGCYNEYVKNVRKDVKMSLGVESIKRDMLKMMDKLDDHEQMFINIKERDFYQQFLILQRKHIDDYKLVNDRITELFDIIKMLEKEER